MRLGASRTTKLTLAYDGGPFAGWAVQPGKRTVAGDLERAMRVVLRQDVDLVVAGRTDRGVHALGQVVSVEDFDGVRMPDVVQGNIGSFHLFGDPGTVLAFTRPAGTIPDYAFEGCIGADQPRRCPQ